MDILENARNVRSYTQGMNLSSYLADQMIQDASERCLARISEAAIKLGPFAFEVLPDQDWASVRGIGNVLRHEYDRLDIERLWKIIDIGLEPLIAEKQRCGRMACRRSNDVLLSRN